MAIIGKKVVKTTLKTNMNVGHVNRHQVGMNINGIHVLRIHDGTLATALPGCKSNNSVYVYFHVKKDPISGMLQVVETAPDPKTGVKKIKLEHSNKRIDGAGIASVKNPTYVEGARLLKGVETPDGYLADPKDKRVWWVFPVSYQTNAITGDEVVKFAGRDMKQTTFGEFVKAVNARKGEGFGPDALDLTADAVKDAEALQEREDAVHADEEALKLREANVATSEAALDPKQVEAARALILDARKRTEKSVQAKGQMKVTNQ